MITYFRLMIFIYFILYYKPMEFTKLEPMVTIYITTFIIFISKTHGNYSPYKLVRTLY